MLKIRKQRNTREIRLEELLKRAIEENVALRDEQKRLLSRCDKIVDDIKATKMEKLYQDFINDVRAGKTSRGARFQKTRKARKIAKK